jgi:sensor histidine kinase YesM
MGGESASSPFLLLHRSLSAQSSSLPLSEVTAFMLSGIRLTRFFHYLMYDASRKCVLLEMGFMLFVFFGVIITFLSVLFNMFLNQVGIFMLKMDSDVHTGLLVPISHKH